jgi:cytochrome P450
MVSMPAPGPPPPGPPLPGLLQAALIWLDPVRFVQTCHDRYGRLFTTRIPGIGTLVFVTDPDDIRSVLRGDPAVFHAGEAAFPLSQVVGPKSILMLDDDKHRRTRAMMLPGSPAASRAGAYNRAGRAGSAPPRDHGAAPGRDGDRSSPSHRR